MANFNPASIKPASKSKEFASTVQKRDAKSVLAESILKQLDMFNDSKMAGHRWFKEGENEVAFSLRYANKALALEGMEGETRAVVAKNMFIEAMKYYREQVLAGKYDDQLATLSKALESKLDKMRATRAANAEK